VVDVGAGNSYPVKDFLSHLLKLGKLNRYVALDISSSMLELSKRNITGWFSDDVAFEGYEYDMNQNQFSNLLFDKDPENIADNRVSLILLLGGTLSNMRNPDKVYKMIHDSMASNDRLVYVTKLDTEVSRKYFDFNATNKTVLSDNHRFVFELLNINETLYDIEMGYDQSIKERYIRVRLRNAIKIGFMLNNKMRDVFLQKDDAILVWRGIHHTKDSIINQFSRNNFDLIHSDQTDDRNYILTVSRVK
jgi:uncharacterized SAM-dependent methyltransferase